MLLSVVCYLEPNSHNSVNSFKSVFFSQIDHKKCSATIFCQLCLSGLFYKDLHGKK